MCTCSHLMKPSSALRGCLHSGPATEVGRCWLLDKEWQHPQLLPASSWKILKANDAIPAIPESSRIYTGHSHFSCFITALQYQLKDDEYAFCDSIKHLVQKACVLLVRRVVRGSIRLLQGLSFTRDQGQASGIVSLSVVHTARSRSP